MTADDHSDSGSDNSGSRDTVEPPVERDDVLPLIDELRSRGGWELKVHLAIDLGLSESEIDEYLQLLEETDEVEVVELGEETLVTLPAVDDRDAVAELSDIKEKRWRQSRGENLPPLDDRSDGR